MSSYSIYTEGDSFLYSLDPRTKLFFLLCVVTATMVSVDPIFNLVLWLACVLLAYITVDYRKLFRTVKIFIPLLLMVIILWPLFLRRGDIIFSWKIIVITEGGLLYAVAMFFRILTLLFLSMIVLMSVKAIDLVTVMHKAKLHYKYSYATMIALNFIPEFATAAQTVLNAQQARGLDVTQQNFIVGIRNMAQLMPPLLTMVFRKAETLSLSMDALAFGAKDTRTYIRSEDLYLRPLDYAAMAMSLIFLAVFFIFKYAL